MAFLKDKLTFVSLKDITVFEFTESFEDNEFVKVLDIWTIDGDGSVEIPLGKMEDSQAEKLGELLVDLIIAARNGSTGKSTYDIEELVKKAKSMAGASSDEEVDGKLQ